MMRTIIIIILSTVVLAEAKGQIQFSAGPGAGVNYAIHTAPNDVRFSRLDVLATAQLDMQFSRYLGALVWIDFYSDMSAKLKNNDYSYALAYLSLAPAVKFCIPGSPFYVYCGPGVGFRTRGRAKGVLYGVSDHAEAIPGMKVRVDVRIGAGYDIFLSRRLTLSPFAGFNAGLNDVADGSGWRAHALQAGIVLRCNIFK
ncbi:MAG: hypothetical protein LBJ47_02325 [Tannerella sp.]|jgi:hypothetical protein|nr:hypothetical protein [Tannerella sp.]